MAQTSLRQTLKQVWTKESFKKAFELEIQDAQKDMRQQVYRQQILPGQVQWTNGPGQVYVGIPPRGIDMSPRAVRARQARQDQMLQLAKRGNKPSYRQRQKNGRAGRKK